MIKIYMVIRIIARYSLGSRHTVWLVPARWRYTDLFEPAVHELDLVRAEPCDLCEGAGRLGPVAHRHTRHHRLLALLLCGQTNIYGKKTKTI